MKLDFTPLGIQGGNGLAWVPLALGHDSCGVASESHHHIKLTASLLSNPKPRIHCLDSRWL